MNIPFVYEVQNYQNIIDDSLENTFLSFHTSNQLSNVENSKINELKKNVLEYLLYSDKAVKQTKIAISNKIFYTSLPIHVLKILKNIFNIFYGFKNDVNNIIFYPNNKKYFKNNITTSGFTTFMENKEITNESDLIFLFQTIFCFEILDKELYKCSPKCFIYIFLFYSILKQYVENIKYKVEEENSLKVYKMIMENIEKNFTKKYSINVQITNNKTLLVEKVPVKMINFWKKENYTIKTEDMLTLIYIYIKFNNHSKFLENVFGNILNYFFFMNSKNWYECYRYIPNILNSIHNENLKTKITKEIWDCWISYLSYYTKENFLNDVYYKYFIDKIEILHAQQNYEEIKFYLDNFVKHNKFWFYSNKNILNFILMDYMIHNPLKTIKINLKKTKSISYFNETENFVYNFFINGNPINNKIITIKLGKLYMKRSIPINLHQCLQKYEFEINELFLERDFIDVVIYACPILKNIFYENFNLTLNETDKYNFLNFIIYGKKYEYPPNNIILFLIIILYAMKKNLKIFKDGCLPEESVYSEMKDKTFFNFYQDKIDEEDIKTFFADFNSSSVVLLLYVSYEIYKCNNDYFKNFINIKNLVYFLKEGVINRNILDLFNNYYREEYNKFMIFIVNFCEKFYFSVNLSEELSHLKTSNFK